MKYLKLHLLAAFTFICLLAAVAQRQLKEQWYQLQVYHFTSPAQEAVLDHYFAEALLPLLHEQKFSNIGAFKAISNDTAADKKIYLVIPMNALRRIEDIRATITNNSNFQHRAENYLNAPYNNPPYDRVETILLKAFHLAPTLQPPALKGPRNERVYELRSYESATEKTFRNKVHMFNEGDEIGLFKKLNFNAVFYSEVVSGPRMPNLMYMTSFENKADRDAHWKAFGESPEWKKLSSMPAYQHNVSHIDIYFLRPTAYSDY